MLVLFVMFVFALHMVAVSGLVQHSISEILGGYVLDHK